MQTARQIGPRAGAERMAGLVLPVPNEVTAANQSSGFVRDRDGRLYGDRLAVAEIQADGDGAPVLEILKLVTHQPQSRNGPQQLRMFLSGFLGSVQHLSKVLQVVVPRKDCRSPQPDAVGV